MVQFCKCHNVNMVNYISECHSVSIVNFGKFYNVSMVKLDTILSWLKQVNATTLTWFSSVNVTMSTEFKSAAVVSGLCKECGLHIR